MTEIRLFANVDSQKVLLLSIGLISTGILGGLYRNQQRRKYAEAMKTFTAVEDLNIIRPFPSLGTKSDKKVGLGGGRKKLGKLVIVGGSFAGLFTALTCASYFDDVTIVEADEGADREHPVSGQRRMHQQDFHDDTSYTHSDTDQQQPLKWINRRKRIIQTFAIHALLPFILNALRRAFPGTFDEEFIADGGRIRVRDPAFTLSGIEVGIPKCAKPGASKALETMWMSRAKFEVFLRRKVMQGSNIHWINGNVSQIITDKSGESNRIKAVKYVSGATSKMIDADFVVDCSGGRQAGLHWLQSACNVSPKVDTFDPHFRTAVVWFDVPPSKRAQLPVPFPPEKEMFYAHMCDSATDRKAVWVVQGEGTSVGVGFAGWGLSSSDIPHNPREIKEFHATMKTWKKNSSSNSTGGSANNDWFSETVDWLCSPENGGWGNAHFETQRLPPSSLIHYHDPKIASSLPQNFVAVGDSVMRTNPVYGVGVTKAMVNAVTLAGVFDELWKAAQENPELVGQYKLAATYFPRIWARTGWHWKNSKISDYGYDSTVPIPSETKRSGWLIRRLTRAYISIITTDEYAAEAFYFPRQWMAPANYSMPTSVFLRTLWRYCTGLGI